MGVSTPISDSRSGQFSWEIIQRDLTLLAHHPTAEASPPLLWHPTVALVPYYQHTIVQKVPIKEYRGIATRPTPNGGWVGASGGDQIFKNRFSPEQKNRIFQKNGTMLLWIKPNTGQVYMAAKNSITVFMFLPVLSTKGII
jgi:hypothetical protein